MHAVYGKVFFLKLVNISKYDQYPSCPRTLLPLRHLGVPQRRSEDQKRRERVSLRECSMERIVVYIMSRVLPSYFPWILFCTFVFLQKNVKQEESTTLEIDSFMGVRQGARSVNRNGWGV